MRIQFRVYIERDFGQDNFRMVFSRTEISKCGGYYMVSYGRKKKFILFTQKVTCMWECIVDVDRLNVTEECVHRI